MASAALSENTAPMTAREMRERIEELDIQIAEAPFWGAALTLKNEERQRLLRAIAAIDKQENPTDDATDAGAIAAIRRLLASNGVVEATYVDDWVKNALIERDQARKQIEVYKSQLASVNALATMQQDALLKSIQKGRELEARLLGGDALRGEIVHRFYLDHPDFGRIPSDDELIAWLGEFMEPESALPRYRHKVKGTTYVLMGKANLQASAGDLQPFEGRLEFAVYVSDSGKLTVREWQEFMDGRFERIESAEISSPA